MSHLSHQALRVELQSAEMIDGEISNSSWAAELPLVKWDSVNVDYTTSVQIGSRRLEKLSACVVLPADRCWYLNENRELRELAGVACPPWPVGRFIVTELGGKLDRWEFPTFGPMRLTKSSGELTIHSRLVDRSACGLATKLAAGWAHRSDDIVLAVSRAPLAELDDCSWIEPFPDAARAVICLTDHCDFDSPEKLRLLADCLVRHNVRITKSVFPVSDRPSLTKFEETGLDDPDYRESIDRLFSHGTEIAFHGFTPKRNAPPLDEVFRRTRLLERYEPETWIDHGTGDYLFSRGGTLADGVDLEHLLKEIGIRNYWSYFDVWDNPFSNLSLLSARRSVEVISSLAALRGSWFRATGHQSAWFILHGFRNLVGDGNDVAIRRRPWRLAGWQVAANWHQTASRVRQLPLGIYGSDGAVVHQSLDANWVFDTILLNHLALQLAPDKISNFVGKGGVLIGHCYMTCDLDYVHENVFLREKGRAIILPAFEDALAHIDMRQRAGDLITLSFQQLRTCIEAFTTARLRRSAGQWMVEIVRSSGANKRRSTRGVGRAAFEPVALKDASGARDGGGRLVFALPRAALDRS